MKWFYSTLIYLIILLLLISFTECLQWSCPSNTSQCLSGGKHKIVSSPENDEYAECFDYRESSCCTANFTKQLSQSTVEYIRDGNDIFNWTFMNGYNWLNIFVSKQNSI